MARRGTRRGGRKGSRKGSRRGIGLVGMAWSPFRHLLMATGESGQKLGSTAGKIVSESVGAVEGVGTSFATHSNKALSNIIHSGKGSRRNARRNSRRNARSTARRH